MKLINKTSLTIIPLSLPFILISFFAFHQVIYYLNQYHIDQNLLEEKDHFENILNKTKVFDESAFNEDHFSIEPIGDSVNIPTKIETVYVYDSLEDQDEAYRQLTCVVHFNGKPHLLELRDSMIEGNTLIFGIALLMVLQILIFLFVFGVLKRWSNKKIWRPFYVVLDQLERFDITKPEQLHLQETKIDEFEKLNSHIEEMVLKISNDFRLQREMFDMVSHENQTPLAVIRSYIELMFQQTGLNQEHYEILSKINENIGRLSKMNQSILLLTRIESGKFITYEAIQLDERIKSVLDEFQLHIEAKNLDVFLKLDPKVVYMHSDLADAFARNLIQNAVRHNKQDGKLTIILNQDMIQIQNSGDSPQFNLEEMKGKFVKNSADKNSIGLGMNIITVIANQYDIEIKYEYHNNTGTHMITAFFNPTN